MFFCQFKILVFFCSGWNELITKLTHETKIKPLRSRVRSSSFYRPARYDSFNIRPPTCWNYSLYFNGSVVEPVLTCHWFQRWLEMYSPFMWPNVGSSGSSGGWVGGVRNMKSIRLLLSVVFSVTYFYKARGWGSATPLPWSSPSTGYESYAILQTTSNCCQFNSRCPIKDRIRLFRKISQQ